MLSQSHQLATVETQRSKETTKKWKPWGKLSVSLESPCDPLSAPNQLRNVTPSQRRPGVQCRSRHTVSQETGTQVPDRRPTRCHGPRFNLREPQRAPSARLTGCCEKHMRSGMPRASTPCPAHRGRAVSVDFVPFSLSLLAPSEL